MGSCDFGDHVPVDNIHTDITTCNIEKTQQTYHLDTVTWGLNMFYWIQIQSIYFFGVRPGSVIKG